MYSAPFSQNLSSNGHALGAGVGGQQMGNPSAWAGPGFAPQSIFGNLPRLFTDRFGGLPNIIPQLAQNLLPFQAGPQGFAPQGFGPQQQQFDPQGFWSTLKNVVGHIPQVVGTAQQVASLLPFQAGPQGIGQQYSQMDPQFDPQGFWSSLKNVVSAIPQVVGTAQQVASLLPFQAGPQGIGQQYSQMDPQFDPQGFWSSLKNVVSHIPQVVGTAQQVASLLPLQAGPQLSPQSLVGPSYGRGLLGLPVQYPGSLLGMYPYRNAPIQSMAQL